MAKLYKDILDLWEASSGVDRPSNASLLIISDACYSGEWVLRAGIRYGIDLNREHAASAQFDVCAVRCSCRCHWCEPASVP